MVDDKHHAFALALLLASLIIISGCTSSKYNPCCVKSGLYDETGAAQPSPKCYFPNETLFGTCTLDIGVTGAANCSDGSNCGSIDTEDNCVKTASCTWNESLTPKCSGGQARWLLAVCQDLVPKSCVNDKCTAMVCGYSSITPSPPPASQDWDANKSAQDFETSPVMPPSSMILPVVNLQGATCDFNSMNKKLYNKITSSRGGLWVNSFRFGVGSSFGDYEAARNFFPATDLVCAANPYAKIDRFTTYLNSKDTFCQPGPYYTCNKLSSDVSFKDERACKLYCGGGVPPFNCTLGVGTKYVCNSDGFAYIDQSICKQKCGIITDVNACTNDTDQFPFLVTDSSLQARYRLKYVSDYMVDTSSPAGTDADSTCYAYGQPTGNVNFYPWVKADEDSIPNGCQDYGEWGDGPWYWTYNCSVANIWRTDGWQAACSAGDKLGDLRTYFDNHAYSSVDFDYDFYVKNLFKQYKGSPDANGRLQYECKSGNECISGSCDTTYYKRPMCEDTDGNPLGCACSKAKVSNTNTYYPSCNIGSNLSAYSDTGINSENAARSIASDPINSYGPLFYPEQSYHMDGSATSKFIYYFRNKPPLFEICDVPPTQPTQKKMCIMKDRYCSEGFRDYTSQDVIWEAGGDGKCHYSMEGDACDSNPDLVNGSDYWEYSFNLSAVSGTVNMGQFGNCKMNGEAPSKPPTPPYLQTTDLGWCAPCTYATLAVQKVDFGATTNPGGVGAPKAFSCYEYRGEFNYIPDGQTYPTGGDATLVVDPFYSGQLRTWSSTISPSTQIVRKTSNPSAYERGIDGNIAFISNDRNGYHYFCKDQWHGPGGWWLSREIPTPSAPYLKEKLTSYLQSNVMPILDEQSSKTQAVTSNSDCIDGSADPGYSCNTVGGWYSSIHSCAASCVTSCTEQPDSWDGYICRNNGLMFLHMWYGEIKAISGAACNSYCSGIVDHDVYSPLAICNSMGGDGAVVHVIGNSSMLGNTADDYGTVMPGYLDNDARRYLGLSTASNTVSTPLVGNAAIIARTSILKKYCSTPPLVGIEILPTENASTLIGTSSAPGKLHKFFYNESEPGFAYRAANGIPDKVPDNVDMLLLDWYPMCIAKGRLPGENESYEFDRKMDFARAIMAKFSKPMLVWKFAFPQDTNCNTSIFLDYMFSNTAAMVDSGMIGVIYSDWMMKDGLGYGPVNRSYNESSESSCWSGWAYGEQRENINCHTWEGNISTGLTQSLPTVRGTINNLTLTLDNPRSMTDPASGKGSLFCALQLYSKRAIGFIPLAYGQKLYAENQTCECQECTAFDYVTGACDSEEMTSTNPELAQIYCNDGAKCAMPSGRSVTGEFRCADRCMNATACKLCNEMPESSSFCRITPVGSTTFGTSKCYSSITDDCWEFLAGLSPSEKCCLQGSAADQSSTKYTYTMMTGTKQQSEFLQFPAHGEQNIDCGRSPDTSVLEYCNIHVPISQKEIACMKISTPICRTDPGNTVTVE